MAYVRQPRYRRSADETPGKYEAYPDMGLEEWIKVKIVIDGAP